MEEQEMATHKKKSHKKGWLIAVLVIVALLVVLGILGNVQKKKNQEEAARLQQQIQLQQEKTDCYAKAAQLGTSDHYDEAVNGPAFAACDAKYGSEGASN